MDSTKKFGFRFCFAGARSMGVGFWSDDQISATEPSLVSVSRCGKRDLYVLFGVFGFMSSGTTPADMNCTISRSLLLLGRVFLSNGFREVSCVTLPSAVV